MPEVWICGDCRSVNNVKAKRCYKCHVPRATAELTDAAAAMATSRAQQATTLLAKAARLGARYRPTWPLAILAALLVVAATAASFYQLQVFAEGLGSEGVVGSDPAAIRRVTDPALLMVAAYGAALLVWCTWIALVVRNVPALTARWSPNSAIGAFFAPFIPFIGLKRPYTVVRNVLALLSQRPYPILIAMAWWIAVLATYFAPTVVILTAPREAMLGQILVDALEVRLSLLVVSAVLAVAVLLVVELEQHRALRARERIVVADGAATTGAS